MNRRRLNWRIKLTELANKMGIGGGGKGKVIKNAQSAHSQLGSRPRAVGDHSEVSAVGGESPGT